MLLGSLTHWVDLTFRSFTLFFLLQTSQGRYSAFHAFKISEFEEEGLAEFKTAPALKIPCARFLSTQDGLDSTVRVTASFPPFFLAANPRRSLRTGFELGFV
jgi:hypothetical protein